MSLPSEILGEREWRRKAKQALDPILAGYPFQELATAPTGIRRGFVYYDTTLNKLRCYDGTTFNNLW